MAENNLDGIGRPPRAPDSQAVNAQEMLAELVRLVESSRLAPERPASPVEIVTQQKLPDANTARPLEMKSPRLSPNAPSTDPKETVVFAAEPPEPRKSSKTNGPNGNGLASRRRSGAWTVRVSALVLAGAVGSIVWLELSQPSKTPPLTAAAGSRRKCSRLALRASRLRATPGRPLRETSRSRPRAGLPFPNSEQSTRALTPRPKIRRRLNSWRPPLLARRNRRPQPPQRRLRRPQRQRRSRPLRPRGRSIRRLQRRFRQRPRNLLIRKTPPRLRFPRSRRQPRPQTPRPRTQAWRRNRAKRHCRRPGPRRRQSRRARSPSGRRLSPNSPTRLSGQSGAHAVAKAGATGAAASEAKTPLMTAQAAVEPQAAPLAQPAPAAQQPNPNPVARAFGAVAGAVGAVAGLIPFVPH